METMESWNGAFFALFSIGFFAVVGGLWFAFRLNKDKM